MTAVFAEDGNQQVTGMAPGKFVITIDPKMRAFDYKEAFEQLRKEKAPGKVFMKLVDGSVFVNIIDMTLMGNSTVFLLRFNTPAGIKTQAIELEMVQGIGYLD
jgi:hypothetical protein